jgi:hypothetical protein
VREKGRRESVFDKTVKTSVFDTTVFDKTVKTSAFEIRRSKAG